MKINVLLIVKKRWPLTSRMGGFKQIKMFTKTCLALMFESNVFRFWPLNSAMKN